MKEKINVGDKVPSFDAIDQFGNRITSEDLLGQPTVIYFYPKDDTPGCTKEACSFRDQMDQFTQYAARVMGVSPDPLDSHKKFAEKYQLNFSLITDKDASIAKAFGAYRSLNFGINVLGIQRSTFIIDAAGFVAFVERGVNVDGHSERVLAALKKLCSPSSETTKQ